MQPAKRLNRMRQSSIREMTRLALQHDAINLSQGFPDFDPPQLVLDAAHRALDTGLNQYGISWGMPALRQAISAKMKRWYNIEFDPDVHVTVTCGVTEAISCALMAIVDPGDEVIIIEPFHEGYFPEVIFAGGIPRFVSLQPPDYALDPAKLRAAFNERTRAIIVNTPHNPTGRVFTRDELNNIAKMCEQFDAVAITDEIYEHITYDGRPHIPLATLAGMADRTITISGFGKTFAATGWRLGYACAPEPLSAAMRTVHDFTTICAPVPLQAACVAALEMPESFYSQLRRDYQARRESMMAMLEELHFTASLPEGSYYVLADFDSWKNSADRERFRGDDFEFARMLTEEYGVAVVPGSSFYSTPGMGNRTVRFAFAKKLETLQAARERLKQGKK